MRTVFRKYTDGEIIAIFPEEVTDDDPRFRLAFLSQIGFVRVDPEVVYGNTIAASKAKYARTQRTLERDHGMELNVELKFPTPKIEQPEEHLKNVDANRRKYRL